MSLSVTESRANENKSQGQEERSLVPTSEDLQEHTLDEDQGSWRASMTAVGSLVRSLVTRRWMSRRDHYRSSCGDREHLHAELLPSMTVRTGS